MPCGNASTGSSSGNHISYDYEYDHYNCPTCQPTTYSGNWTTGLHSYDYIKTYGQCTNNYHKRVARGELIAHTLFKQFKSVGKSSHPSGNWTWDNGWAKTVMRGSPGIPPKATSSYQCPSEIELQQIADSLDYGYNLQKAAADIYTRKSHDTLTFLAELHKTRDMFKNMLIRLVNVKRNLKKPPKYWDKTLSSWWLEARYGWRPLLYDIQDINEVLKSTIQHNSRQVARSRYSNNWTNTASDTIIVKWNGSLESWDVEQEINESIVTGTSASIAADFFSKSQWQFNLPRTAWETIPYSFVVDWVINVGQAIEALSLTTLADKYVASGGYYVQLTRDITENAVNFRNDYTGNISFKSNYTSTMKFREPTRVPILPQTRLRLNNYKVMDLISLFIQDDNRRLQTRR